MIERKEPPIVVSTRDYDRLISLAMAIERRDPSLSSFLIEELERASLLQPNEIAPNVVTMYSRVEFLHHDRGSQCVTLVYPNEENIAQGKISVLTPIGAALLGLAEGDSFDWTTRTGQQHRLTVLKVHAERTEDRPPER